MARKRMFSIDVIETDNFLSMPSSTRDLYVHLNMHADDDGFVSSPNTIRKICGSSEDDIKLLIAKKYVIPYLDGVCVITDWNINNTLKNDRYKKTIYSNHLEAIEQDENKKYYPRVDTMNPDWIQLVSKLEPKRIQIGTKTDTQHNKDKHSEDIGKENIVLDNNKIEIVENIIRDLKEIKSEIYYYDKEIINRAESNLFKALTNCPDFIRYDYSKVIEEAFGISIRIESGEQKGVGDTTAYLISMLNNGINEFIIDEQIKERNRINENNFY